MLISLPPRPDDARLRLARLLDHAAAIAQRRIDDMIGYATTDGCRHGYLSAHFGSPPRTRCDVCDNCTGIRPQVLQVAAPDLPLPDDEDIESMILDCLVSLPKPVGRSGLARILAGAMRAPVSADRCRHHGRLYTLGEGTVMEYIDDLIEQNYLRQYERQGYPVLAATMRGRAQAEAWLAAHPELAQPTALPAGRESPDGEESVEDTGQGGDGEPAQYTALQKALWAWRHRTARKLAQPLYVIMGNELMLQIAERRPQSLDELASLPGMGASRLQRYGGIILDLVRLHPAQEGDAQLLQAQRDAQQQALQGAPTQPQDEQPAVSAHTERRLYLKLQELRQRVAVQKRCKPYLVANNTLLKTIARTAPTTQADLENVLGFRSSGLYEQAEEILAVVREAVEQEE